MELLNILLRLSITLSKENIKLKQEIKKVNTIEWLPVSVVATLKDLSPDGLRKQLQNGDFEENFDFKKKGSRILINQGAIARIRKKRRSSNACVL